jgi:hypothetical protein
LIISELVDAWDKDFNVRDESGHGEFSIIFLQRSLNFKPAQPVTS